MIALFPPGYIYQVLYKCKSPHKKYLFLLEKKKLNLNYFLIMIKLKNKMKNLQKNY